MEYALENLPVRRLSNIAWQARSGSWRDRHVALGLIARRAAASLVREQMGNFCEEHGLPSAGWPGKQDITSFFQQF